VPQQLAKAYRLHARAKVPSPADLAANVRILLSAGARQRAAAELRKHRSDWQHEACSPGIVPGLMGVVLGWQRWLLASGFSGGREGDWGRALPCKLGFGCWSSWVAITTGPALDEGEAEAPIEEVVGRAVAVQQAKFGLLVSAVAALTVRCGDMCTRGTQ
jgi:hypothetical protein